jgi:hypothetical protein
MPNTIDAILLLIPLGAILIFSTWALWNFSAELRASRRRRVRRPTYTHQVKIYTPPQPVLRFRRSHDKEAA